MANLAWHFVKLVDGKPQLRDGRPLPPIGEWLEEKEVAICEKGLHASWRAIDALTYSTHLYQLAACLVEVEDVAQEQDDKFVCHRRKVLAWTPANDLLRLFARECAISVLHLWNAPDVVKEYLDTGDESIRQQAGADASAAGARHAYAAYAAAYAADAAYAAADAAAAAVVAAYSAAYYSAAYSAAADAARSKARDEQNTMLESILLSAMDYTP